MRKFLTKFYCYISSNLLVSRILDECQKWIRKRTLKIWRTKMLSS